MLHCVPVLTASKDVPTAGVPRSTATPTKALTTSARPGVPVEGRITVFATICATVVHVKLQVELPALETMTPLTTAPGIVLAFGSVNTVGPLIVMGRMLFVSAAVMAVLAVTARTPRNGRAAGLCTVMFHLRPVDTARKRVPKTALANTRGAPKSVLAEEVRLGEPVKLSCPRIDPVIVKLDCPPDTATTPSMVQPTHLTADAKVKTIGVAPISIEMSFPSSTSVSAVLAESR